MRDTSQADEDMRLSEVEALVKYFGMLSLGGQRDVLAQVKTQGYAAAREAHRGDEEKLRVEHEENSESSRETSDIQNWDTE